MNCAEQCVKLACKKKLKHSDNAASSLVKFEADDDDDGEAHTDHFTSLLTSF